MNRHFWTGGADGEHRILRCGACCRWLHPPSGACPLCHAATLAPEPVSGRATVFTFNPNWYPFNPAVPLPTVIALVELREQEGRRS